MKENNINWLAIFVENNKLSLGRISFWITFVVLLSFWFKQIIVPPTLMTVFLALLSYNLGKKVRDSFESFLDTKKDKVDG